MSVRFILSRQIRVGADGLRTEHQTSTDTDEVEKLLADPLDPWSVIGAAIEGDDDDLSY